MRFAYVRGLAVLAASGLAAGSSSAPAFPAATRLIDRTFSCSVALRAGARPIVVSATSGFRDPDQPTDWRWRPLAVLKDREASLASIAAGEPPKNPQFPTGRGLVIDRAKCTRTTAPVVLSARGLVGGRASQLRSSDSYDCRVASRVLVRVRAVFRRPTTLSSVRYFGRMVLATPASAVVREAQLSVRTPAGRRVAYADVVESGRARLFTAPGCTAD